jgi:hypothetical protein
MDLLIFFFFFSFLSSWTIVHSNSRIIFPSFFSQIYTLRTEFFCRSRSAAVTSSILPFDLKLNCPRIHRLERLDQKSSKRNTRKKKERNFIVVNKKHRSLALGSSAHEASYALYHVSKIE